MKILIFNGSPRKNGDTAALIRQMTDAVKGEIKVVNTYRSSIRPCSDCRYCWKNNGCRIDDGMQRVYEDIREADCIVIASPLYFSELTGSLLNILSRLQMFYAAKRFLKVDSAGIQKIGVLILCGGGDGGPAKAEGTARTLFQFMNAELTDKIYSLNTDSVPAAADEKALAQIKNLAAKLNGL